MPSDHHPLAFQGAVDQLRQLILGLCNAMGAHKLNIAIRWLFCPVRDAVSLDGRSGVQPPDLALFLQAFAKADTGATAILVGHGFNT